MTEFTDTIKDMVSCKQFAEFMGLTVNRSGFAVCPFHADKDASLKIYKGDRGWVCFGCHKGGDVINMASLYYGLPFVQTVKRLNDDFSLGLPLESSVNGSERLLMAVQHARRRTTRLKEKRLREAIEREYWHFFDLWLDSDRRVRQYAPKAANDPWSDAFVKALLDREESGEKLIKTTIRRGELYANK